MAVEYFTWIYMWESMGQRDRSVRLAELPLQQRRMLPKSISTPLPPVAPAGAWSAGGIEAISPKHTNQLANTGGCSIEGWDGGQTRCFPEGNSTLF